MTTIDAELFTPFNVARAKLLTGDWQLRASCARDVKFTTRPVTDQLQVCADCPVAKICQTVGMYPVIDRLKATYACGHPRSRENTVHNGRRKDGSRVTLCRECRASYRAARRAA